MRRKKGKTPFGFREIKEGSKDLEEIPEEIAALEDIKDLIKLCEQGPPASRVNHVEVSEYKNNYLKKDFDIIKSD